METIVTGNKGLKVRSDCEITLEPATGGGIRIELKSKVKTLYGASIEKLCTEILNYFNISDAYIKIDDSGALPFVISARLEAAIRKLIDTDLEYLPEFIPENNYTTAADRFRFSRLYLPGNNPSMMINAGLHSPDGIILDLEDSVAPTKKDEARILVRNALRQIDFHGAERMVRINQGKNGLEDLNYIVRHNVNLVLVPKCENPEEIIDVDKRIKEILKENQLNNPVYIMPVIESPLGVENAFSIAKSARSVVALAIGLEDFTASLGVARSLEGKESFYARTRIVIAAKAASIQPIDSVFSNVDDMDSLRKTASEAKSLGFEGMGCIHPRQIPVIRDSFAPDNDEIKKAMEITAAFREAEENGLSVVALGSKMIDPPVVMRARKIIELAGKLGIIQPEEA